MNADRSSRCTRRLTALVIVNVRRDTMSHDHMCLKRGGTKLSDMRGIQNKQGHAAACMALFYRWYQRWDSNPHSQKATRF